MNLSYEGIPLYLKIKKLILNDIQKGLIPVGTKLPSEQLLCEQYEVSRITIRRAITELEMENYVRKQQGKGTFVVPHTHINIALMNVGGFEDTIQHSTGGKESHHSHSHILSKKIVLADLELAQWLSVPKGSKVLRLKRVFTFDSEPYMIDNAWFPLALYPNLYDLLVEDISTFKLITDTYHYRFAKVYKELTASVATKEESQLLECSIGAALFCTKKLLRNEEDVPIHFSKYVVKSDNIVYTLTYESQAKTSE